MAAPTRWFEGAEDDGFQSLFCWIGNGGGRAYGAIAAGQVVSILVLLDWEWRRAPCQRPPDNG